MTSVRFGVCLAIVLTGSACWPAENNDVSGRSGKVSIDKTRLCPVVDGKPFFAIGWCGVPPEAMKACAEAGANVTIRWGGNCSLGPHLRERLDRSENEGQAYVRAYYDAAQRAGLRVIEFPCLFGDPSNRLDYGVPSFHDNFDKFLQGPLPQVVDLVKGHPALFGYYGPDEPNNVDTPESAARWRRQLGQYSDIIRKRDPNHPVVFLFGGSVGKLGVREWTECYDIMAADFYPTVGETPLFECYRHAVDHTRIAHKNGRPYWQTPVNEATDIESSRGRYMPPAAQRMQVYLPLIAGAQGIVWWWWPPRHADTWDCMKELIREVRALEPVLTEPPVPTKVRWVPEHLCETIQVRAIRHDGRTWLLAANPTETPAKVRFTLPATLRENPKVWFEDREIDASGRTFSDDFEAHTRHVYEIDVQFAAEEEIRLQVQLETAPPVPSDSRRGFPARWNLLQDPGFERDGVWTFESFQDAPPQARGDFDSKVRHGGKRAAVVYHPGGHRQESRWIASEVTLKANTSYVFGGWARAECSNQVAVEMQLFASEADAHGFGRRIQVPPFAPWRLYWRFFRTGDKPTRFRPACRIVGYSRYGWPKPEVGLTQEVGTAWFDDMFLIEAPADISNMLLNGSFDGREIAPGWPQWWFSDLGSPATPGQVGSENPLWGTDDSAAFQGQKSFRLVNPGVTQVQPGFGFPNVKQELPLGTRLQKGKSYVLSAYMKADPPNLQTIMYAGDYGLYKEVRVGSEWQRYVARVTPETDHGRYPHVMFDVRERGKLWIDAVQFEEGIEPTDFNEWRLDSPSGRTGPPDVATERAKKPSKPVAKPATPAAAEPAAQTIAEPAAPMAAPGAKPKDLAEKERKDTKLRHFGYVVWDGPPSVVAEISPYTNVLVDTTWLRLGHGILEAADKARVPTLLVIFARERDGIESRLFATMEKHRDTIQGIYWAAGLTSGYSSVQVSEFAKAVKSRFPKTEIWVSAEEREFGAMPSAIPSEIDGIVVNDRNDRTPEAVRAKADEVFPKWLEKVGNRGIILNWQCGAPPSVKGGLVPDCQAGTLRACVEAARRHNLAGVLFSAYDDSKERATVGIRSRPELVDEVRKCGQELGIGADR